MHIKLESLKLMIRQEIDQYLSEIDSQDVDRLADKLKKQVNATNKVKEKSKEPVGKRDDCHTSAEWLRFQNQMNKSEKGDLYKKK